MPVVAKSPAVKLPTIHLNGSGKRALLDQACAAGDALRAALQALAEATPDGRDYYPQGNHAAAAARADHEARHRKVQEVLDELDELALGISRGGHGAPDNAERS